MGDFALAHADQAECDHAVLRAAVRKGRITVCQESTPSRPYRLRIFWSGQIAVSSGAPSAAPADVVYSIEPLIFFFNKLIQTTFVYLNAALRLCRSREGLTHEGVFLPPTLTFPPGSGGPWPDRCRALLRERAKSV